MKCISCGAELAFDPKTQKLKCEYCKTEYDPKEYKEKSKKAIESTVDTSLYTCTQCGAKLLTFDETAVTFCSYCGSSMVLDSKINKEHVPELVVPFKITKEECEKLYKKKIKKYLFAPKSMKDDIVISKFRGIYMPFAIYDIEHHGSQFHRGSKYAYHFGNYDYYKDYQVTTDVDCSYKGIQYDLASNFSDKFSQAIIPFDLKDAVPFDTKYMSGFYADAKDVDDNTYSSDSLNAVKPIANMEYVNKCNLSRYGCSFAKMPMDVTDIKVAYLPVYFLAIKNKKNNRLNYAVINGQNGKIAVELSIDFKKYLLFTIILSAILFLIVNAKVFLLPTEILPLSLFSAILSLIISLVEHSKLKKHDNYSDDKGYKIKNKIEKSKIKAKIWKQIIAILIFFITKILNPVNDIYYYIAVISSLLLVIWSFYDLIDQYNKLTSRKPNQLLKRGGDERE